MNKLTLSEKFNIASTVVKTLPKRPEDKDLLELYALYKQALCGNCNTDQPGILQFKERSKWSAWKNIQGMEQETAMEKYCNLVEFLIHKL